jgi:glycine/D-amino acid oxidase-like deaminating enzyme
MRHQYALTDPIDGVGPGMPTVRDPDRIVYFRPKDGGLLVGGYARDPITEPLDDPLTSARTLYPEDRPRFAESWAGAQALLPVLRGTEPPRLICGPEAFTPDGEFVLGRDRDRRPLGGGGILRPRPRRSGRRRPHHRRVDHVRRA